jgi:hypothetical protein
LPVAVFQSPVLLTSLFLLVVAAAVLVAAVAAVAAQAAIAHRFPQPAAVVLLNPRFPLRREHLTR